jgi:Ca-activated chloride channel family protein
MQRRTLASALLLALTLSACTTTGQSDASKDAAVNEPTSTSPAPPPPAPPPVAAADEAETSRAQLDSVVVTGSNLAAAKARRAPAEAKMAMPTVAPAPMGNAGMVNEGYAAYAPPADATMIAAQPANTEKYEEHADNPVHRASEDPVSTFSIDVDTGSYSNVRRMLRDGVRPPADAVRAEEMINYFSYGHPAPASLDTPFRVTTELSPAPWNGKRQLLMVGIKGYDVPKASLPPANLVFLIDTSGSMESPDKLPLLKQAFTQLTRQLRPQDHVSIVVYAGSAGLVLPPTGGDRQGEILTALDRLSAGGSTNGGDGIRLAYAMAKQGFVQDGVNRVILATDGDFNVGTVDQGALETLVADQRKSGIALTTLGFGQGNYNDAMAEKLADVGDGNHAYIDTAQEARKVLVQQMGATLLTIAKDVKIQIEFNPALVAEYRLIGYENRVLRREDFANDKVDAGDIGAGHEVTALYEITPVGSDAEQLPALRYGAAAAALAAGAHAPRTDEIADLRLRYKRPGEDTSRLIDAPILRSELRTASSERLRFASAVAAYADALRGGTHLGSWHWSDIATAARSAQGEDPWHQRAEFLELVDAARAVTDGDAPKVGMIEE